MSIAMLAKPASSAPNASHAPTAMSAGSVTHPAPPPSVHELPPVGLYIHVPWCARKCPYCDFNSHAVKGELPEQRYVQRLLQELHLDLPRLGDRPVQSVFFGGGTPSLLMPQTLRRLLSEIPRHLNLAPDAEITLEANPDSSSVQRFAGFRRAGVNRLSIGVQSFNDQHLQQLGRTHNSEAARHAVHAARQAGFKRINLDLMHGLPQQTAADALADLQQALQQDVSHVSWYQLTLEPNTVFYRQPPLLPREEVLAEIEEQGSRLLATAGFQRYEISAWAQPGQACRHNLNYWQFGDYLGLGPGAHGKLTTLSSAATGGLRIQRTQRSRMPQHWLAATPSYAGKSTEVADAATRVTEFMLNVLRLTEAVHNDLLIRRTGVAADTLQDTLDALRGDGLFQDQPQRIGSTALGRRYLNQVLARLA